MGQICVCLIIKTISTSLNTFDNNIGPNTQTSKCMQCTIFLEICMYVQHIIIFTNIKGLFKNLFNNKTIYYLSTYIEIMPYAGSCESIDNNKIIR